MILDENTRPFEDRRPHVPLERAYGPDECMAVDREPTLSEEIRDLRGQVRYLTEQLEKLSAAFNALHAHVG